MAKKWLRTEAVCERYGNVVPRSIERAVKDGRLPAPEYPLGNKIPFWDEEKLDEHDRGITTERITRKATTATEHTEPASAA
jgi:hypothetical protein